MVACCFFVSVLKKNGIGYGGNEAWKKADIGEVLEVEMGHCEMQETMLLLKDGSNQFLLVESNSRE